MVGILKIFTSWLFWHTFSPEFMSAVFSHVKVSHLVSARGHPREGSASVTSGSSSNGWCWRHVRWITLQRRFCLWAICFWGWRPDISNPTGFLWMNIYVYSSILVYLYLLNYILSIISVRNNYLSTLKLLCLCCLVQLNYHNIIYKLLWFQLFYTNLQSWRKSLALISVIRHLKCRYKNFPQVMQMVTGLWKATCVSSVLV